MDNLQTTYLGIPIKNPIVVGSSGLSSTIGGIKKLAKAGAAAIVLKSVFEEEIKAEAEQTVGSQLGIDENNLEFYDYYDYQVKNEVLENYVSLIREAKEAVDIPIIASINCSSYSEWVSFAHKIEEAGADAIELNIFKLPFGIKDEASEIEKVYFDIVRKVKERLSIPLGIKLAPYFTNLGSVINRLSHTGVDGLVLFNRFTSVDYDIENDQIVTGKVYSNQDDYVNSLRWISVSSSESGCDLVASTGVHDYRSLVKMMMAGAASVQVVSAIYKEGPEVIGAMLKELDAWMDRRGFASIDDFKGRLSQGQSANPEVFERVQFMRYFSGHVQ
ncbi:MAG: dihydroorotate dehydrogenase-like protein [Carboxylicivirga sp.]|jgi:dihydroorotate dehydrogenase (fumarate)|nr:dihydroorotate dehydrogenase-like protein [Carboxylicivirga sp.]